ncbi:MAG: cbb3-type cytochrome c oxidase subunit I [Acidobacteria bacterium]|nr:cbb3-type cytochrome c oxidase subunit I [Acidobacteriota bacterium]
MEAIYTDPETGLRLDRATHRLIVTFLATAFLALGGAALAAFFVALTRAPAIQLLWPSAYYMALTFHGILALTIWPHVFEATLWLWACTSLLRTRLISPALGWLAYGLAVFGILMILGTVASGNASVMYTMYVPLRADPLFYLGHIIYALGLLTLLILFGLNLLKARADGTYLGSLPLLTYGMAVAAILTVVAIIGAVAAFVPTVLWAFRILISKVDPLYFKATFWSMGHTLQYTNITAMVVAWYGTATFTLGARPVSEKFSRWAFALYLITTLPVFMHHFLVDPTWSHAVKWVGATVVGIFLGIPSAMHGLAVPASVEKTLRSRGVGGLWGWFRQWGWNQAPMVLLAFSVVLFGLGGFDGTVATTMQLNMIEHNNMWIPAHIHGTLAGGATLGFMAFSYGFLPHLGFEIKGRRFALPQAWITGIGFALLITGMHWGAHLGVPRRMQDIRFLGADAPVPDWLNSMNLLGVGGVLAATGILTFVTIGLASVLAGNRRRPEMLAEATDLWLPSERPGYVAGQVTPSPNTV